jgi:hypothetical protein
MNSPISSFCECVNVEGICGVVKGISSKSKYVYIFDHSCGDDFAVGFFPEVHKELANR